MHQSIVNKTKIGVYRTVYPLYSETFISNQIYSYSQYEPILICRDLTEVVNNIKTVTIGKRWSYLKKISYTMFGCTSVFDDISQIKNARLIHAHFAQDAVMVLPLAKKLKIPLVVTCHGSDVLTSDKYLATSKRLSDIHYLLSRKKLMKDTSLFIAVSNFLQKKMIEKGFPSEKIIRHYIGVDSKIFVPNKKINRTKKYILSIARHTDVKGIDILLKAFSKVSNLFPDVQLIQIGAGQLTNQLKLLASKLGIMQQVNFLGSCSHEKVLYYIQSCEILVLSSRISQSGAEEAFGLVLNEASACGIPCIGTDVGGIPEAIEHGSTGFIVNPENITELAERMATLISDSDLANSMGKRGREMVCDMFDLQKQMKILERLYEEL